MTGTKFRIAIRYHTIKYDETSDVVSCYTEGRVSPESKLMEKIFDSKNACENYLQSFKSPKRKIVFHEITEYEKDLDSFF